ncbi:MAG: hypothetical protein GXO84_05850 [Chlorobi bacterium]|nr:hypothetical protein [Chlorobiota bacterium]
MNPEFDLFISLSAIAGIFIGFGALITVTTLNDKITLGMLRGIVSVGLLTLVGCLIPVLLGRYGIENNLLWRWSSGIFFTLIWFALLHPAARQVFIAQFKLNLKAALFFWIVVEIPIQLPLILAIFGIFPNLHPAFYTTAIILNLVQAGILLVQIVYATKFKNDN